MICAVLKTTVNSELQKLDFSEFKTTGKSGINELRLDSTLFFSEFPVVLKAP
jgi:hypothetical protein